MAFDIEQFYVRLDEHYGGHDNAATEEFLLRSKARAAELSATPGMEVSCPSCVESPEVNLEFVSVCNELGCFYRSLSRWQEAVIAFQEGLDELRRFFQDKTPTAAMLYMNLADTQRLMGRLDGALGLFHQAEQILIRDEAANQPALAGLYNNLALVYQAQGNLKQTVECAEHSISILRDLGEHGADLGAALNNLAAALAALGRQDEADAAICASVELLSSQDCGVTPHYPAALNTKGIFAFRAGDLETAAHCFTLALEKTGEFYGKNAQYAAGCRNCAEVYQRMGQLEKAAAYRAQAEAVAEASGI